MRLFRILLSLLKINSSVDILRHCTDPNDGMCSDRTVNPMQYSYIVSDSQFCNVSVKDRIVKPHSTTVTKLPVTITAEELSRLTVLVQEFKISDVEELDRLLSVVLSYERRFVFDSSVSYPNPVHINVERIAIMICIFIAFVTIWMFAVGESFKKIMLFLYFLCFLGGLAFNAWRMYMEAISKQMAEHKQYMAISRICDSKKTSWWSYLFFSKNKCLEFEKTSRIHPLSKVIPSVVFSHTLSITIIHPLQELGIRCGDFLVGVSNAAPWPFNLIFLPFVLIVFCLLVLFVIMAQMGASFNCWTWLGGLSIKVNQSNNSHNRSCEASIDVIRNKKKYIKLKNRISKTRSRKR